MAQVSVRGTPATFAKCLVSHVRRVVIEIAESQNESTDNSTTSIKQNGNLIKVIPTLYQSPWQLDLSPDADHGVPFQHNAPCPALAAEGLCAHMDTSESASPTSITETVAKPSTSDIEKKKRTTVRVGVCVLIESADNKVLLTQRSQKLRSFGGKWVLPGGNLDPEETLVEAGAREVLEETGLLLDENKRSQLRPLCMWESTWPDNPALLPITHHHVVVYMHVRVSHTAQQLQLQLVLQPEEVAASAWIPRDQVHNFISLTPSFHQLGKLVPPCRFATESNESIGGSSAGPKSDDVGIPSCDGGLDNVRDGDGVCLSKTVHSEISVPAGEAVDVLTVVQVSGEVVSCSVSDVAGESPSGTTFVLDQWLMQHVDVRVAGL